MNGESRRSDDNDSVAEELLYGETNQTAMLSLNVNYTFSDSSFSGANATADHGLTGTFSQHYHLFKMIETYFIPLTCLIGIVCNTLAVITFLHKDLRKHSCSIYLITKSISDMLFLLNLAVIYICGGVMFPITGVFIVCHILIFVTYISGFVSVWSVICVTVENFIRIQYPFKVKQLCTTRNAKLSVCLMLLISLCVYNFSLWISDSNCKAVQKYSGVTEAFVLVDTLLTLVLPSILLTILIVVIVTKVLRFHSLTLTKKAARSEQASRGGKGRKSRSQIAAVCKMLLAVSLTFFILTVPSHIVRIKLLVSYFLQGQTQLSSTEGAIQGISQLFFYFSMAVNLFIFLFFGDNFRKVFKKSIFKKNTETVYTNVSCESRNVVLRPTASAPNFQSFETPSSSRDVMLSDLKSQCI